MKRFLGWEPREEHYPEYDESGRWVRTVVIREPEFDSRERSLILAHLAAKADMGPYGVPVSRATATDAEFKASDRPTVNKAAMAAHRAQERYFKQYPQAKDYESALLWSVTELPTD